MEQQQQKLLTIDELCERYYEKILRHAYYIVHDCDLAEVVTQESFLKATRAFDKLRSQSNVYAWLSRIATNTAYDELRKRLTHEPILSMQAIGEMGRYEEEWQAVAPPLEEMMQLKEALQVANTLLSENQLRCLYEHLYGYSYAEIAAHTGLTHGSVRTYLYRATRRMREYSEQERIAS